MITSPTFMFLLSDIMRSYPLHTHDVVLFLVSSSKQTFGVRRVVSVADRTWENIDLTFSSLWVRHSILITSTFGNCYDDSLHLGIIRTPQRPIWRGTTSTSYPDKRWSSLAKGSGGHTVVGSVMTSVLLALVSLHRSIIFPHSLFIIFRNIF